MLASLYIFFIAGGGKGKKRSIRAMTHPVVGKYGDLFSSIDNFVAADALAADEEVAAVAPTF